MAQFGGHGMAGDIDYIAQEHWEKISKITEQMRDGSTKVRYEDGSGRDITAEIEKRMKSGEEVFFRSKRQS